MTFLANYEPVEDRLRRFWADHPDGRVTTSLVSFDGERVVFQAEVFRDSEDPRPFATGFAHEVVTPRGVNATSALENCETSAVGRALANANYAPKGARPSQEEMAKTVVDPAVVDAWAEGVRAEIVTEDVTKARLRELWQEVAIHHGVTDPLRKALTTEIEARVKELSA